MKKILIIEDEPDVAETMKILVEKGGYKVDYTLNPEKGLKMVKDYDLLLLDIAMPGMSGYEILSKMKKRKINIPIIVVSAVGIPEQMEKEIKSKYPKVGYVSKIEIYDVLVKEIRKKIGK